MMKGFLLANLLTVCFSRVCVAQILDDKSTTSGTDVGSCEFNRSMFDSISSLAFQSRERIFVIFRAGKTETELVNSKRLFHVKHFFEMVMGWNRLNAIYASGEKTNGNGQVEVYVGSKLILTMLTRKNRAPCLTCCGEGSFTSPKLLVKSPRSKKRN